MEELDLNTQTIDAVDQNIWEDIDLGTNFEKHFSEQNYSEFTYPKEEAGVLATLNTNESWFDKDPEKNLKDGAIIGIGAGTIFSMVSLYEKDNPPECIIGCDVMPEVILVGRLTTEILKDSNNYEDFKNKLQNNQQEYIDSVIKEETNSDVKRMLTERSAQAKNLIQESLTKQDYEDNHISEYKNKINILMGIKENWKTLKEMANLGNIAFVLSDMTQKDFLDESKKIKDKFQGDTIFYLTNAIEHITDRWTRSRLQPELLKAWQVLEPLNDSNTHFVHTTSALNNYTLQITDNPPIYNFNQN